MARHRRAASTWRPSGAAAATSSRSTRCSPTCAAWQNVAYPLRDLDRGASAASGRTSCSSASASRISPTRARARCPAASASASRSPARSRGGPGALLLDEPLSALDPRTRGRRRPRARRGPARHRRAGRSSSPTTSPRRRCSATGSASIDGGRVAPGGHARPSSPPARVGVRGRLHRRGRPDRDAPGRARTGSRTSRSTAAASVVSLEPGGGPGGGERLPVGDRARPGGRAPAGSAHNHLPVEVVSVTTVGDRVRVGLAAPQPLTAEITDASARELGLAPGTPGRRHVQGDGDAAATSVKFRR